MSLTASGGIDVTAIGADMSVNAGVAVTVTANAGIGMTSAAGVTRRPTARRRHGALPAVRGGQAAAAQGPMTK